MHRKLFNSHSFILAQLFNNIASLADTHSHNGQLSWLSECYIMITLFVGSSTVYKVLSHVLFYLIQIIKGSYLQNGEYPDFWLLNLSVYDMSCQRFIAYIYMCVYIYIYAPSCYPVGQCYWVILKFSLRTPYIFSIFLSYFNSELYCWSDYSFYILVNTSTALHQIKTTGRVQP